MEEDQSRITQWKILQISDFEQNETEDLRSLTESYESKLLCELCAEKFIARMIYTTVGI